MTTIAPWSYAATQITTAKRQMDGAASAAAQSEPRPGRPPVDPMLPGPDNPCFPPFVTQPGEPTDPFVNQPGVIDGRPANGLFPKEGRPEVEAPEAMMPPHPYLRAEQLATQGMQSIDSVVGLKGYIADEVITALENAKGQATAGVKLLKETTTGIIEPGTISKRFQSSSMWLNLAGSLLALNHDTKFPAEPIDLPLLPGGPKDPVDLPFLPGGPDHTLPTEPVVLPEGPALTPAG